MPTEKILIIILVILAVGGFAWSAVSFFSNPTSAPLVENTSENFEKAKQAELPDKCQTPDGYTNEDWYEHMSHHPDRYKECLGEVDPAELVKHIGPDDLTGMLEAKDFELIDVHIPEQAHIPGTDKFIPFDQIKQRQIELPQDKDAKIVLYCRSGSMSRRASEDLVEMGYTNVYNLVAGVNGWKQSGYAVENPK